jgi:HEPN domain-containing protein
MKKNLAHLPDNKQDELKHIVSVIHNLCDDVEMIILFGSYARGDYKEETDLKPDRKSGHKSDYDILVVSKNKSTATDIGLWQKITKKCNYSASNTHVQIISHDIQELNIKLAEGQYFYTDVKKEGCMLYNSNNFKLAGKHKLKPDEQKRIAQDYFDYWYKTATMSFEDFQHDLKKGFNDKDFFRKAAFNLHQAAEHSYKTILLVFTNYNPNEHLLDILGKMAAKYHPALKDIFPQETKDEQNCFELLAYAYIGARYDPEYRICKEELKYLSKRVKLLLDITGKICKTKIESFM